MGGESLSPTRSKKMRRRLPAGAAPTTPNSIQDILLRKHPPARPRSHRMKAVRQDSRIRAGDP